MLEILRSAQDDIGSEPAVFEKIDSLGKEGEPTLRDLRNIGNSREVGTP